MAASSSSVNLNTEKEGKQQESDSEEGPECAVCLQTCVLPTRLPCRHVFCFLCAKGLALQSRRCAMCRADIPQEFLERPELLEPKQPKAGTSTDNTETGDEAAALEEPPDKNYAWFYEGRNGWWQYEARLSEELESAYQGGSRTHDALIAGSIYTLDFNNWMQSRRDDPARRRRIKRDLASCQHKGVAGLRQLASAPGINRNRINNMVVVGNTTHMIVNQPQGARNVNVTHQRTRVNRNHQLQNTGIADSSGLPPAPGGTMQQQMGVPLQVYQHQGGIIMQSPQLPANQTQGIYPPSLSRRGTSTRNTHTSTRGITQGRVNRRGRNRTSNTNAQVNNNLRRIIAAAANNAFTQGLGVGAALYSRESDNESSEEDTEEESPPDESSEDDGGGLGDFLFRGRNYVINKEPIDIDALSDSD